MINHIIIWKFKDAADGNVKEENLRKAKAMLEALPTKIPQIKSFHVGLDVVHSDTSYDMVLMSRFENLRTLAEYQVHPEHVKVAQFLRKVHQSKIAVDYES
jgi:hypothetical protein